MKLMVIDGNSILNRAFYGVRPLSTRDGTPTNAVYGFLTILQKLVGEEEPDALPAAGGTETGCLETMLVGEALRVLSAGEYPVVVLHVFAGLKLTEIARYLDIPYGTVLWRYSEGKKKLKRYYEQLDKGERRETHVG